jgi:hypothetical protein
MYATMCHVIRNTFSLIMFLGKPVLSYFMSCFTFVCTLQVNWQQGYLGVWIFLI